MQKHSRLLIEELAKYDLEIIVFHPHVETIFPEFENIKEIHLKEIDVDKNYLKETYNYSKQIFEYLIDKPEFIIYSQGLTVWYGISKLKNKIIINPHGLEPYQAIGLKNKFIAIFFKIAFNFLFKKSTKVISLGGKLTDILKQKVNINKISIIPNGVKLSNNLIVRNTNNNVCKILFLGRFALNKGIDLLIQSAQELNNEGYSFIQYYLAGDGPLFEELNEKNNSNNIFFLGKIEDNNLKDLYSMADIFVLPTLFEGMPTVVLEAMSYSLPIIVTDVGATSELVNENNGFLIKKNDVSSISMAIKEYLHLSSKEKQTLGINSYKKIESRFTWHKIALKHFDLFESLFYDR